ncbi:hypothetical protein [Couchioplanes caeruleus]|uniref:Uncharacterized protein n=2 Tax=Couchioplanes caeruleus TaxID=56438 RepID=A0A1K0G7I3_9ACTN|nr:hypothetical protein [Couchioplanes caeruleus]OJF13210.1 hypothetical protein BG844_16490 [Couchioplanes caeruleus subsp. caeruleus]ROP27772.1 hypothetical protein EDD30_0467 [Couchioplanes caeruleus]
MDLARAGQIAVIMLSPTLAVGVALYAPRVARALWHLARRRDYPLRTYRYSPPIEQLATDLRRLLLQHDELRTDTRPGPRGVRLRALEAAITDLAVGAARALNVPASVPPAHAGMPPATLRRLLHDLTEAGLALPAVGLLAGDRPR